MKELNESTTHNENSAITQQRNETLLYDSDIASMEAEYEMLRAEILQYMEEYQTLRNMMYVGTAALLGLNTSILDANIYLFLLPLIIILPSYIIHHSYWKAVSVASVYIQLFLEKDESGKHLGRRKWETMHQEFSKESKRTKDDNVSWRKCFSFQLWGMVSHDIPYYLCATICLGIYGYFMFTKQDINQFAIIIGILALVTSLIVFIFFRAPSVEKITETWQQTIKRVNAEISARNEN